VLSDLPQSIGDLSLLEELWVNGNKELKALPSTIGSLWKLKKLVASSCALSGRIYF
jgi:Leucine-rich repeat (LRR) protein